MGRVVGLGIASGVLVLGLVLTARCSSDAAGSTSGVDPNKYGDELTPAEKTTFCEWSTSQLGIPGERTCDCGGKVTVRTAAECEKDKGPHCKISLAEACIAAVKGDACKILTAPECHDFIACAAMASMAIEMGAGGASCDGGAVDAITRQHVGKSCDLAVDAGVSRTVLNTMASECPSKICVKPAQDLAIAGPVDTGPTCSAECATDADCGDAELRGTMVGDLRCKIGFACAVATEVGDFCCKKICLCKDFIVIPDGGLQESAGCDANNPVNRCKNLPGR